jgi:hypothetical protein
MNTGVGVRGRQPPPAPRSVARHDGCSALVPSPR